LDQVGFEVLAALAVAVLGIVRDRALPERLIQVAVAVQGTTAQVLVTAEAVQVDIDVL
jgi:hypothetical protein